MDAILHIGLPKAGSTHIQTWLDLNRGELARAGIVAAETIHGHRLGIETFPSHEWARPDIARLRATRSIESTIADIATPDGTLALVSSEYLSQGDPLEAARLLGGAGIRVRKIIAFIRRQDLLSASGYTQEVRSLGRSSPIGDIAYHPSLDWNLLFERWWAAFPAAKMAFHNYERCRRERSLIAVFKKEIGAGHVDTQVLTGWSNKGLSAEFTEIARMANEARVAYDIEALCSLDHEQPRRRFGFGSETTRRFEAIYRSGNQAFARRSGAAFEELGTSDWLPAGIDLTHRLPKGAMDEVLARLRGPALSPLAA